MDWRAEAACRDAPPDEFYRPEAESRRAAKRVCAVCPVITDCLETAQAMHEPEGIWGGLLPFERRRIEKRRAAGG